MRDLISVYIPTKNRVALLKRALQSVLSQTYNNIEIIIVDDGSDDGTTDYIRSVDSMLPLRVIRNEKSLGSCAARNQAIEASNGVFVTGLDDDDWFGPNRIELFYNNWQSLKLANEHFSLLFGSSIVTKSDGNKKSISAPPRVTLPVLECVNRIGSQVFTLKKHFVEAGMFDVNMPAWQDWDLWFRIVKKFGPALSLGESTYYIDESHTSPRISEIDPRTLKEAMELFGRKHQLTSMRQKSSLMLAYSRYPHVKLKPSAILLLLVTLRLKGLKRCLSESKYEL